MAKTGSKDPLAPKASRPRAKASSTPRPAKKAPPATESAPAKSTQPPPSAPLSTSAWQIRDPAEFAANMVRVGTQAQKLIGAFVRHQRERALREPVDPLNFTGAFFELARGLAANPAALAKAQGELWHSYAELWERTARTMLGEKSEPLVAPRPGDKRFRDPDWQQLQVFDFIKQSYLLTANWLQETVANIEGLDAREKRRIEFFTKQFADAIAPSNFILTNPEVLRTTLSSNGENLINGLKNLLDDLERGGGDLAIRQSADSFRIGENIATAPGKVIFRNDLIELLQFSPTSPTVYRRPLLIFPPWINKYYILDLKPENSFIRWMVQQGYTVFVVSWVNPDAGLAHKTFSDYMHEGVFAALEAVHAATGERRVNAIGYCIGGTLLSAALAYMAASNDDRIAAAVFFAAQTDFSEAGDLSLFIDDTQLKALEQSMTAAGGVLKGSKMAATFNMLRANDLIWSFVISNYLLGKEPLPFDLLYWNADTTRMPAATHLFYLRRFYRDNALATGRLTLDNVRLDLSRITIPVYLQSAREDHIAPCRSIYKTTQLVGGPVRFILAGSGHIAGVVNPPAAQKYQYWTNSALPERFDNWMEGAEEHKGSWWPDLVAWLGPLSGDHVPARVPGDGGLRALGDAPGTYVKVKAQ
ncbi:MAG: class I poly(R)-hydroxyalkanoic acid synthase [Alphaproteobacteria bacterium]|nr:class I poly(R)-hydroxyalkanoic acid synthase [Alphaproteobacteria bacterium]